jgi:GT2 family glycosyltransferase
MTSSTKIVTDTQPRRALVVLGMHRSGTSAVARLLAAMGVHFGADADLLPASDENPKGYFEHRKLVEANQVLLVGEHASWIQAIDYGSAGFACEAVTDFVRHRFEPLARDLVESLSAHPIAGLKDPRLCLTLPCWQGLLPEILCLHVIRDPLAVASSLEQRAGIPLHAGIGLWELYNRRVLDHAAGLPCLRLSFEALVADPAAGARQILDFLGQHGIDQLRMPAAHGLGDAVDAALVHRRAADTPAEEILNASQLALLHRLRGVPGLCAEHDNCLSAGARAALSAHERLETERHSLIASLEQGRPEDHRALAEAIADRDELSHLCDSFRNGADAVFQSLTWKSGSLLRRAVLAAGRRDEGDTAEAHLRRVAAHFSRWKHDLHLRTLGSPSVAALAALWVRLNGHRNIIATAVLEPDPGWDPVAPGPLIARVLLPLRDARADMCLLPVKPAELVSVPADLLVVQLGALEDPEVARQVIDRAEATDIPIICIADRRLLDNAQLAARGTAARSTQEAAISVLRAATVVVALDPRVAQSLEKAGHIARLLPSARPRRGQRAQEDRLPETDMVFWQALISELQPTARAGRETASFDWPRLPLVNDAQFDEACYVSQNPDVAIAIGEGGVDSAMTHWLADGRLQCDRGDRGYVPGVVLHGGARWTLSERKRTEIGNEIASWPRRPLISIVMPTWNSDPDWLSQAVDSVLRQAYPHWELCIADDGATRRQTLEFLRSLTDARIKIDFGATNNGIAAASNAAIALAGGEYIALLDHDDLLAEDALYLVAERIVRDDPDLIYSDEDKVLPSGELVEPFHKPDYSPDLLLSQNYFSHLGVYRRALVAAVGGFRGGYEGSQDYDLVLRCTSRTSKVAHIPHCLYHWRIVPGSTAAGMQNKDYAWQSGRRAIESALGERGIDGTADVGRFPGTYRLQRRIHGSPRITVIIPFRDQPALLETCMGSLLEYTHYDNLDILGISNDSSDPRTFELMHHYEQADSRIRFLRFDEAFNYSRINNYAVAHSDGDHLLFLNNDIEVLHDGWLDALLEHSQRADVACVGARLLYPDRTVQHAGVIVGLMTLAAHAYRCLPEHAPGYFGRPWVTHDLSVVTGACMMVKRQIFEALGGFNERDLTVALNDVDLCLRARELGYLNLYTPWCEMIHHESKSRGTDDTPEKQERARREVVYMRRRHARILALGDPYHNPNLSLWSEDVDVATRLPERSVDLMQQAEATD